MTRVASRWRLPEGESWEGIPSILMRRLAHDRTSGEDVQTILAVVFVWIWDGKDWQTMPHARVAKYMPRGMSRSSLNRRMNRLTETHDERPIMLLKSSYQRGKSARFSIAPLLIYTRGESVASYAPLSLGDNGRVAHPARHSSIESKVTRPTRHSDAPHAPLVTRELRATHTDSTESLTEERGQASEPKGSPTPALGIPGNGGTRYPTWDDVPMALRAFVLQPLGIRHVGVNAWRDMGAAARATADELRQRAKSAPFAEAVDLPGAAL